MEAKIVSIEYPEGVKEILHTEQGFEAGKSIIEGFFKACEAKGHAVKVIYYSPFARQGFYVPVYDKDRKRIPIINELTGRVIMRGRKIVYREQLETFESIAMTRTAKNDALCQKQVVSNDKGVFSDYDKDMIISLEQLCSDPSNYIKREAEHKAIVNPAAYEVEKKLKALEKENETLRAKADEAVKQAVEKVEEKANKRIEDIQTSSNEEIARLQKKFDDDLTKMRKSK